MAEVAGTIQVLVDLTSTHVDLTGGSLLSSAVSSQRVGIVGVTRAAIHIAEHVATGEVNGLLSAHIHATLFTQGTAEEVASDVTLEEVDHDITRGETFHAAAKHILVDGNSAVDSNRRSQVSAVIHIASLTAAIDALGDVAARDIDLGLTGNQCGLVCGTLASTKNATANGAAFDVHLGTDTCDRTQFATAIYIIIDSAAANGDISASCHVGIATVTSAEDVGSLTTRNIDCGEAVDGTESVGASVNIARNSTVLQGNIHYRTLLLVGTSKYVTLNGTT